MVLNGKQKAAMLLMSLDAATATELLKGVEPERVQELAVELAYLDAAGLRNHKQRTEVAHQFCNLLQAREGFHLKSFLDTMLKSTVGNEKAGQIQIQIGNLLQKRDPFMSIRSADSQTLASVLENEHPQAVAVVLVELSTTKSSEVIGFLREDVRLCAINSLTDSVSVTVEAKRRIAEMICKRLESVTFGGAINKRPALRKVALMLRNLGTEIRDGLLHSISEKDSNVGKMVMNLMIIWEDIIHVTDHSLQQALREIDSRKLTLSLIRADEEIAEKIKSNISERAAIAINEETSLMSNHGRGDIERAREEIVKALRRMNEKGRLRFIEE